MYKKSYKSYLINTLIPSLFYGGITGIFAGGLIFFFKLGLEKVTHLSDGIYSFVRQNPIYILLLIPSLILLALLMNLILHYAPNAKGGGIPTSQGIVRGLITFKWLRTLIGTITASFITFSSGLPLGTEGPAVLIGTSLGAGTGELTKKRAWRKYIMTGGAAAGFGVATGAPLAGVIFALEETHKRFSPMLLLVAFSSVLSATAVSQLLCKVFGTPILIMNIGAMQEIPFRALWYMPILGIAIGLIAALFNYLTFKVGKLYDGRLSNVPSYIKICIAFVAVGIAGIFIRDSIGSGHRLIYSLIDGGYLVKTIIIILVIKVVLIILSTNSGATGGLFFPLLTMGALLGAMLGKVFIGFGMDEIYYKTIIIIGMCAFFGASIRAPITAMVFVVEATGNFNNLLFSGTAIFIAFLVGEALDIEPLNDVVLNRMLRNTYKNMKAEIKEYEIEVKPRAFVAGRTVRDILWPANSIVRHIVRAGRSRNDGRMIKDGDKKMYEGDLILIQAQTYDSDSTYNELQDLLGLQ